MSSGSPVIVEFGASDVRNYLDDLTEVLHACVHANASVGFVLPFARDESRTFWTDKILPPLEAGGRILLASLVEGRVTGTVQLDIDMLPSQVHRCEIAKLLVHPAVRRQGIAKTLMAAAEQRARDLGRTLITLDTKTGDSAEPLYQALGFETAGTIPGYCRHPGEPGFDSTTYMYKAL
jgi:ribosomal protein S18 acetylase RimI-like enzyme